MNKFAKSLPFPCDFSRRRKWERKITEGWNGSRGSREKRRGREGGDHEGHQGKGRVR